MKIKTTLFIILLFLPAVLLPAKTTIVVVDSKKGESAYELSEGKNNDHGLPLQQVIFVDQNNHPAPFDNYHQDHQCQLKDYNTSKLIAENHVFLHQGEQLLIRCNDGSLEDYFLEKDGLNFDSSFISFKRVAHDYDWDIYWHVSYHGPYFLIEGRKEGSGVFNVYYSGITGATIDDFHAKRCHYLLGTIEITVE